MKGYIAIKYMEHAANRTQVDAIARGLSDQGVDSICVARDLEKWGDLQLNVSDLMKLTFKAIDECDFLLVEMTVKGVGLGIEAGYAHAIGKPIVVIARRGADISGTLSGILSALHFYSTEQELKDVLCKIVSFLRASLLVPGPSNSLPEPIMGMSNNPVSKTSHVGS